MKKITQEEFDNFERDKNGYKICPTGDYSDIKEFGDGCRFGNRCVFGNCNIFGNACRFGNWCKFGHCCGFGERCSFGDGCIFGIECIFGYWCRFGDMCCFGETCIFCELCRLGKWCSFGDMCCFYKCCKIENDKQLKTMLKFDGFGSKQKCVHFFLLTNGQIYVRCGCFAGYIDEFKNKVKETHGDNKIAQECLKICDLVEWKFEI